MNKIILKTLVVFCLITSCKSKEVEETCELFKIGNWKFYNPRVYDNPIIFEKGNNKLLNKEYEPEWYAGYCAENLPAYFSSKEDYVKYVHSAKLEKSSLPYFHQVYEKNKTNTDGFKNISHDGFHLLFRGTINVKNMSSGSEYLLVAGKSYLTDVSEYDKNTEYYEPEVKNIFAYILEDGVYKSVDIDYVMGSFSKPHYDKVYNVLSVKTIAGSTCFENVNTLNKPNFDTAKVPDWVHKKSQESEKYLADY